MSDQKQHIAPNLLQVRYASELISFEVRPQPNRRHQRLSIHVEPSGRVVVDAPCGIEVDQLLEGVKRRLRWISTHLEQFRAVRARAMSMEYVSGESMLYLGRRYRLKVLVDDESAPAVHLRGPFIEVTSPRRDPSVLAIALKSWYRERARDVFAQRLPLVAEPLGWVRELPPTRLQFMKQQWGSCSPSGCITLNPWLVRAPRQAVDYVLLHEMCHLRHHNHSRAFYKTLDRHMPNWREIKGELDGRAEEYLRV